MKQVFLIKTTLLVNRRNLKNFFAVLCIMYGKTFCLGVLKKYMYSWTERNFLCANSNTCAWRSKRNFRVARSRVFKNCYMYFSPTKILLYLCNMYWKNVLSSEWKKYMYSWTERNFLCANSNTCAWRSKRNFRVARSRVYKNCCMFFFTCLNEESFS